MAGALSFTLEPTFYGDFTMDNLNARQFQIVNGYFTYDAASASALTVTASMVGLNRILGFVASPKGNVFWNFTPGTNLVQPVPGVIDSATVSASLLGFNPTASFDVASITSIPFLCWGFR